MENLVLQGALQEPPNIQNPHSPLIKVHNGLSAVLLCQYETLWLLPNNVVYVGATHITLVDPGT